MWPMRLPAKSSLLAVTVVCLGAGFFSNPEQLAGLASGAWETSEIGAVWADDFNRASLGANWINLGSANANLTANELRFSETSYNSARRVYYQPWLIGSDAWTIRWTPNAESGLTLPPTADTWFLKPSKQAAMAAL